MPKNKLVYIFAKYHLLVMIIFWSLIIFASSFFTIDSFFNLLDIEIGKRLIIVNIIEEVICLIFSFFITIKEILTYKKIYEVFNDDKENNYMVKRMKKYAIFLSIASLVPIVAIIVSFISLTLFEGEIYLAAITYALPATFLYFWAYIGGVSDRKNNIVNDKGFFNSGEYVIKFTDIKKLVVLSNPIINNPKKYKVRVYYLDNKYYSMYVNSSFLSKIKEKYFSIKTFDINKKTYID